MAKLRLHVAAVAMMLMTARVEAADSDTQAREHYDRAVQYYGQRDYAAAVQELRRAEELRPHYRLNRALAQVYAAMLDHAAAYTANRLYLQQGADKITPERRQEVTDEMAKQARLVALVSVAVDVPGADVRVDDARVGQTPLESPIALNAGPHRVVVSYREQLEQSQLITAVAGSSGRLEFQFARQSRAKAPGAPSQGGSEHLGEASGATAENPLAGASAVPSAPPAQADSPIPLWIGWVATGALAAGATATGLWALSIDSSLDEDRKLAASGANVDRGALVSRASRLRVLATLTDVLWVATAAAGGLTLWFALDARGSEREGPAGPIELQAGVSAQGVSVRGRF
jgi:hypothetical protein